MRALSTSQGALNCALRFQARQSALATLACPCGALAPLSSRLERRDALGAAAELSAGSASSVENLREASRKSRGATGGARAGLEKRPATGARAFEPESLQRAGEAPRGANKCFFPLKSDPTIGHLVAPSKRKSKEQSERDWLKALEAPRELAGQLGQERGAQQLLLEAPKNITASHDLAALLNRNPWREPRAQLEAKERLPEQSAALAQKAAAAPAPNLLLGRAHSKVQQFQREVDNFMPVIRRKKSFARHFRKC